MCALRLPPTHPVSSARNLSNGTRGQCRKPAVQLALGHLSIKSMSVAYVRYG